MSVNVQSKRRMEKKEHGKVLLGARQNFPEQSREIFETAAGNESRQMAAE